jgi:hypothetical protein
MEILLITLGVVLFGGMFAGLLLSYRDIEAERLNAAAARKPRRAAFYGWTERDAALNEELMLRQIEHHLRREAFLAEQFIRDPNPQTLRAGERSRLGAN